MYLSTLLGESFWQSLGTAEWCYFAVGILAVVALVITIVFAVLNRKKLKQADEQTAETADQTVAEAVEQQTAAAEPAVAAQPIEEEQQPVVEQQQPVVEQQQPVAESEKAAAPTQPQQDSYTQYMQHHMRDVVTRGKILIRYDKSNTAKLMQADATMKDYYDLIKNELLSYKGVKSRVSWKYETFRKGRVVVARLKMRRKHLRLMLPLNPNDYVDTKYKIKDLSHKKKYADTPCGYAIKNNRRCLYANELIATVMEANGTHKIDKEFVNYSKDYPYDTTEHLIQRKLIKLIYGKAVEGSDMDEVDLFVQVHSVAAEDVQRLMTDAEAEQGVEESTRVADKTKGAIINVDVLSRLFEAGERVTLDELKKRVHGLSKKTTYIKVLARGVIDKPLIVEADDYSIDAVKMILLTGGTVIRTKKK